MNYLCGKYIHFRMHSRSSSIQKAQNSLTVDANISYFPILTFEYFSNWIIPKLPQIKLSTIFAPFLIQNAPPQCYYAISILHYSESWQLNQLQACKWNVELSTSWNVGGESFALKDKWMHVFPNRIILLRSILSSTAYLVGKFNALAIVEVNEEQMK